jgi:hypothetical protein
LEKNPKVDRRKPKKPKITDQERHKRFLETAREVGASDDPKDFDQVFTKVVHPNDNRGQTKKLKTRD